MQKAAGNAQTVRQEKRKSSRIPGILIIALGLLLNQKIIEKTIIPDGSIELLSYRILIAVVQLLIIAFGIYVFRKRPEISPANISLAVLSLLFSALLAGVALQIFYTLPPMVSGWRPNVPGNERNQLGYRGHPIKYSDDDYVVLLVGDSQVEAFACDFDSMPDQRLQYYLNSTSKKNVKVFTIGASGYGQDQQYLALKKYYQNHRADLVIVWLTPRNDVWNNMFPTHWATNGYPKPTFRLENGELRGPSEQMGEEIPFSPIKLVAIFQRLFLDRDGEWEKYLPEPYKPLSEYNGPVSRDWQKRWDSNIGLMRYENLDNEKSHLAISLTPRSKRMQYGLELTRRLLQEIGTLVKSHNGRFVIFRTADPLQGAGKTPPDVTVHILNGRFYMTSEKQFEENMRYITEGFTSYVIPVTVKDWRVSPTDSHLNKRANDQVMRDLADILKGLIISAGNRTTVKAEVAHGQRDDTEGAGISAIISRN